MKSAAVKQAMRNSVMTASASLGLTTPARSVATRTFQHVVSYAVTVTSQSCTTSWGGSMTITGHKHQHDYKPGWTYLNGQQQSKEVVEAKNAAADAWLEYEQACDAVSPHLHTLLDKAVKLQKEAERLSREWNRNYKD